MFPKKQGKTSRNNNDIGFCFRLYNSKATLYLILNVYLSFFVENCEFSQLYLVGILFKTYYVGLSIALCWSFFGRSIILFVVIKDRRLKNDQCALIY